MIASVKHGMAKESTEGPSKVARRRVAVLAWRVGLCAWLTLTIWPVTYGSTRLAQCVLFGGLLAGALMLWWRPRWIRWSLLGLVVAAVVLFCAPGRKADGRALKLRYVRELHRFEGTRYVWGGENRLGIDCSGLARRALIHALWKEGLKTANPALMRSAAKLWWRDASARALAAEYDGQTRRIGEFGSISEIDDVRLRVGDLAVTADGVHVLVNVGQGEWSEADPDEKKVLVLKAKEEAEKPNSWLKVPVTLVRWRMLLED
jgi:hypothetical protein